MMRILIPEFIQFPPMLDVYDIAHSLLLGIVDMDFLFIEIKPEGISWIGLGMIIFNNTFFKVNVHL